jgi:hypothetical protein
MKIVLMAGVMLFALSAAGAAMADNTGAANAPGNLVSNGGFGAGNIGFSSDYAFANPSQPGYSQYPETQYEVATNTIDVRSDGAWGAFGGPEANEKFLMINGATTLNTDSTLRNFWSESVNLAPNTEYKLAFDVANAYPVSPPTVALTLGGATASNQSYYADGSQGAWTTETFAFNSGGGGSEKIGLADSNLVSGGNDFAVGNISLAAAVPEPSTWAMLFMGVGMIGFALRRRSEGVVVAA